MAFPTYHETLNQAFSSNTTSFSVNLPATVNSGDLLWLHLTILDAGTITGPAGWTNLRTPTSVNIHSGKVADGTEGGTSVSISTSGSATTAAAQVIRVSNWSGSLADIESAETGTLTSTATFDPPNLAPSYGADDTLWITSYWAQFKVTTLNTYPSNTTNQNYQNDGSGGARCEVASATRELNASSWNPSAFVVSGNQDFARAHTFAIPPAASSLPIPVAMNSYRQRRVI